MATVKLWSSFYNSYLVPYAEAVRDRIVVYEAFVPYVKEASQENILFMTIGLIATALIVVVSWRNVMQFAMSWTPKRKLRAQHVKSKNKESIARPPPQKVDRTAVYGKIFDVNCLQFLQHAKRKNEPPMVPYWLPFLGSAIRVGTNPIKFYQECQEKYGNFFSITLVGRKMVTCLGAEGNNFVFNARLADASAEEAYKGLTVPVFGTGVVYDVHNSVLMEQKRFVKAGLSQENLRAYVPMIINETVEYLARWNEPKGVDDIHKAMSELVILTASRCLLGDDVRSRMDESFAKTYHDLDGGFAPINFIFDDLPIPANRLRDKAHIRMRNFFLSIMQQRRESKRTDTHDIMQYLLDNCEYKNGRRLSDQEAAHILIALLLAGQHTSSTTSAWALIYLAQNPELFDVLREEQIRVLGSLDAEVTFDSLKQMPILDNVVRETLRLRPPIMTMIRKVLRDLPIPGTDYVIPQGAYMQAVPMISQRDDGYFKNADKFSPFRWEEYDKQQKERDDDVVDYGWGAIHTSSAKSPYLPFGAGRHRCIGESFAYVQIKTILATFVRMFDLRLHNNKFPEVDFTTLIVTPVKPLGSPDIIDLSSSI
ncbi:8948_t:CDS:2 [Paraglomus brasilianum]|uniref:8948_t:CDS:1 n=1 Tax=Paraglomus brasilianum TaxID=144538 RepID=A0A9N9CN39_9GLOM|nr:8948_t:CDS:2 [Paraglomus brasilianum]